MKNDKSGIYLITHTASGKVYVGSAINLRLRFIRHRSDLKTNTHFNPLLQRHWNKYGAEAFCFSVLEFVDEKVDLIPRETYWIAKLNAADRSSGFNFLISGGGRLGMKHSEETKAKIGAAHKGKKISPEHAAAVSAATKARQADPSYALTLIKIGLGNKGKKVSPESRARMSEAKSNMSAETRAKISAANKGKILSDETRARIGKAAIGRKQSPEHIASRVAKTTGKKRTPEQIAKWLATKAERGLIKTGQQQLAITTAGRRILCP